MDFMDFSRRLYRWASEGVDMYDNEIRQVNHHTCRANLLVAIMSDAITKRPLVVLPLY